MVVLVVPDRPGVGQVKLVHRGPPGGGGRGRVARCDGRARPVLARPGPTEIARPTLFAGVLCVLCPRVLAYVPCNTPIGNPVWPTYVGYYLGEVQRL